MKIELGPGDFIEIRPAKSREDLTKEKYSSFLVSIYTHTMEKGLTKIHFHSDDKRYVVGGWRTMIDVVALIAEMFGLSPYKGKTTKDLIIFELREKK